MSNLSRGGIAWSILAVSLWCGGLAHAQATTACADLPGDVIYGAGGSAQKNLIGRIASQLAKDAEPLTVVYFSALGACTAMKVLNPGNAAADRKITGTADYWVAGNLTAKQCTLPDEGVDVTFGSMQSGPALCAGVTQLFDGIGDFEGPIGTVNLIVPINSTENSISSEAAHFVFGFGDDSGVDPWTVGDLIARRNEDSAVQLYLGLAAQVPATNFAGIDQKTQTGVINAVVAAPVDQRSAAIGIVSGDAADAARDKVRTLAYQHIGQNAAYWPDSTSTAFDKINVRSGQYYLWGTTHFYAPIGDDDAIADANTKRFVDYITAAASPAGLTPPIDSFIDAGYVPDCAMHVKRVGDLAPLASYQPDEPCGCYFESRATGRTDCDECQANADCPKSAPKCRNNYCEVK